MGLLCVNLKSTQASDGTSVLAADFADGETMQSTLTTPDGPGVQVPVMVAAELQVTLCWW